MTAEERKKMLQEIPGNMTYDWNRMRGSNLSDIMANIFGNVGQNKQTTNASLMNSMMGGLYSGLSAGGGMNGAYDPGAMYYELLNSDVNPITATMLYTSGALPQIQQTTPTKKKNGLLGY